MGYWDDFCDAVGGALEQGRDQVLDALKPLAGVLGFDGATIRSYSVSASRLIQDADLPTYSAFQGEILNAILNDNSIPSAVRLATVSGPSALIKRYLRYGEDDYYFGTPELGFKSPPIHKEEFIDIVETFLTNQTYTDINPFTYDPYSLVQPTAYDWALSELQKNYGYKNNITIDSNVYTLLEVVLATGACQAKLVRYTDPETPVYEYIDLPDITATELQTFYRWKGTVQDSAGTKFVLSYLFPYDYTGDSGEHPEMVVSPEGDYDNNDGTRHLPVVPFKKKGVYTTAEDASDYYTSCKVLLKKINIDLDGIVNNLRYTQNEAGEDIPNTNMSTVTDAYFVMGVNPHDTSAAVAEYLYYYFYVMYYAMAQDSFSNFLASSHNSSIHTIKIEEDSYNITLFFYYIKKEYIEGVLGNIGSFYKDLFLGGTVASAATNGISGTTYVNNNLILKRQATATHYEQLTIHGLRSICTILATDGVTQGQVVDLDDTSNFIIPLSYLIGSLKNQNHFELLIYKSMHVVMFASTYAELEWFEDPAFMEFFALAVQIVVMYFTFGTGATAAQVLIKLLTAWVVRELFKMILESGLISSEAAAILVIAYTVYSAYSGGGFDNMGLADKILLSISAVSKGVTTYTGMETQKLKDKYEKEAAEIREYEEYLKDLEDQMDTSSDLDPYYLETRAKIATDFPDEFFAKKLMTDTTNICRNYNELYCTSKLDLDSVGLNAA